MNKMRTCAGLCCMLALVAVVPLTMGAEMVASKQPSPQMGTLEENDASSSVGTPNFGYVGELGSFEVTDRDDAEAMIVVHSYPDTTTLALGETRLEYVGAKRIGNIEGWVFKTQWDGTKYPSKIFFSAEPVYFGGGVTAFIACDYRNATGWAWKLLPLRRTELAQNN